MAAGTAEPMSQCACAIGRLLVDRYQHDQQMTFVSASAQCANGQDAEDGTESGFGYIHLSFPFIFSIRKSWIWPHSGQTRIFMLSTPLMALKPKFCGLSPNG